MHRLFLAASIGLVCMGRAVALVGGAPPADPSLARFVVTIVGSRGTFCSGALIAPDIVLSAAHCIAPDTVYKIVIPGQTPSTLLDVKQIARHPQFNVRGFLAHRASADVALLRLAETVSEIKTPSPFGAPNEALAPGASFTVSSIGVTRRGDGKSGGMIRSAKLIATGRPGTLQIRLVDPATNNLREGLGACIGDSGAPVFEEQNGRAIIVGVVSWSTGPNNSEGCGGLTGVTPLTLYRGWISQTVKEWEGRPRQ